ncbi:hypothetical protein TNCV_3069521 [Trichonephila clavipes]|nr:hypothetical protein TNCV_3069521 [Trichonephila clavipes]
MPLNRRRVGFCGKKYQGVYSRYRCDNSTYRPAVWFTRCGDIDNLSRDRLLSRKNQCCVWDQDSLFGADTRHSPIKNYLEHERRPSTELKGSVWKVTEIFTRSVNCG